MDDPATYSWTQMSNQTRHIAEYLAITGPDNVTRPMLAESWEASDDLKTWTFHLRQGVTVAQRRGVRRRPRGLEHRALGATRTSRSSNSGLSTFASLDSVEAVDQHTVRLNLNKPVLSAPEDCYNYPTAILHPSFEPPFSDNPIGTGPFTLGEPLAVGDRCILKRITQTTDGKEFKYWGGDVYLDEIHYYHFDADNQLTAFASGDVDSDLRRSASSSTSSPRRSTARSCRRGPRRPCAVASSVRRRRSTTRSCARRIVKATDNTVYRDFVFQGRGDIGENHHVAPIHPEYFQLPPLQRDVEARQGAARGGRLSRRHRPHDRRRQHRRPLAPDAGRALARPAQGCRDQPQHQRDAGLQVLGDLGQRRRSGRPPGPIGRSARWCSRSATAPACRGTSASYANPGVRRRARRRRGDARRRRAHRPRWRRSRRSCRTMRSWCSRSGGRCSRSSPSR